MFAKQLGKGNKTKKAILRYISLENFKHVYLLISQPAVIHLSGVALWKEGTDFGDL